MLVRELMTRDVAFLLEDVPLDSAVRLLADLGVSALPVVDADARVVGILSEADVLRLQLAMDPRAHLRPLREDGTPWPDSVGEVMTPEPVTAHEGSDVADVAHLMADTGWKSVPVVDDRDRLVGMVSRSDVIRVLAASDEDVAREVRGVLAEAGRQQLQVDVDRGVVTVGGVQTGRDARVVEALVSTMPGVRGVVVSGPEGRPGTQPHATAARGPQPMTAETAAADGG